MCAAVLAATLVAGVPSGAVAPASDTCVAALASADPSAVHPSAASTSAVHTSAVPTAVLPVAVLPTAVGGVPDPAPVVLHRSAAAREYWLPPLGEPLRVSNPYRPPPTPYAAGHRGIDLPSAPGQELRAPTTGTVSFVGVVADKPVLSIRVDERTVVSFEPVAQGEPGLSEGAVVARGDIVGVVSEGGHCEAECVHLGVRVDGEYVNPLQYFYARPVLLPW